MALQQLIIRRKSSAIQLSHAPLTTLDRGNLHVIDYKSTKTHPWDIAHDAVNIRSDISFAEPDLDCSEFIYRRAIFHNNIKTVEEYKSYLPEWKSPDEKGVWHLKDKYTGLKSARDAVNTGKIKRTVRIAHLDTVEIPDDVDPSFLFMLTHHSCMLTHPR